MELQQDEIDVLDERGVQEKAKKTSVQSVLCAKSKFSKSEAEAWCEKNGFKHGSVDETDQYYRFRQFDPSLCADGSERTITLTDGVKAVICKKKGKLLESAEELIKHYAGAGKEPYVRLVRDSTGSIILDNKGMPLIEVYTEAAVKEIVEGENAIVHYVSTPRVDYVRDVMDPYGCNAKALEKNRAVFYNHRWSGAQDLPIGKMVWLKPTRSGVLAKTEYAVNERQDGFAGDVFRLVKGGFVNSYSIGFFPRKYSYISTGDLPKLTEGRFDVENLSEYAPEDQVCLHSAWDMHEYSQVGVPMNMDAVVLGLQKGMSAGVVQSDYGREFFGRMMKERERISVQTSIDAKAKEHKAAHCKGCDGKECDGMHCNSCEMKAADCKGAHCKSCDMKAAHDAAHCKGCESMKEDAALEGESKAVIKHEKHPLADEGTKWDAGAEVKKATVDDLKKMCTWYADPGDKKGDFKLPHHKVEKYTTVWNGVRAAMGAVLGARGGVTIPASDKKGVHAHLAAHYKEFGKEVPELKEYTEDELKQMFPDDLYKQTEPNEPDETSTDVQEALENVEEAVEELAQAFQGFTDLLAGINAKLDQLIALEEQEDETRNLKPEKPATETAGSAPPAAAQTFSMDDLRARVASGAVSRMKGKIKSLKSNNSQEGKVS